MTGTVFIDKPSGVTSFSAANFAKRRLGAKKAGHTGTLDPMATGVLVVMLGGATRFIEYLPDKDKSYIAEIKLGITTDTFDIEGTVLSRTDHDISAAEFERSLTAFRGRIKQTPPMYSALKQNGKKLYELAREGVEVERPAREVTIHSLSLLSYNENDGLYTVGVDCSSGTYVRSLANDIGQALGCGAALTALRRTRANGIGEELCKKADDLLPGDIRPIDGLLDFPSVTVSSAQARRFCCGGELDLDRVKGVGTDGFYKLYSTEEVFLGVGKAECSSGILKPEKILNG